MDIKEFLIQHLTEDKSYPQISSENGIPKKQLSQWWEAGIEIRQKIKKANQLFNNKRCNPEFDYFMNKGKRYFYEWYEKQPRKCAYCGIEEEKLKELYDSENGIFDTKRHRGCTLELERKVSSSKSNLYNEENCVFICYMCNNHKSDYITTQEHKKFFAKPIREYLEFKYDELMKQPSKTIPGGTKYLEKEHNKSIECLFGEEKIKKTGKRKNNDNRQPNK